MPYKWWCQNCHYEMNRMYLRTKYLSCRIFQRQSGYERGFESIGWYCNNCRYFELDKRNIIEEILTDRGVRVEK